MMDFLVETGFFLPLAALLGVIVGVAASPYLNTVAIKSAYKTGLAKGKRFKK